MSCTRAKKTELCGLPLLPGSRLWQQNQAKRKSERDKIDNMTCVIDDTPPKANLRREINLFEMKNQVDSQTRREMENREMLNTISFTWQNPSGVDSVNTTRKVSSTRQRAVEEKLKEKMRENVTLATKIHAVQSNYDNYDMAFDWKMMSDKRESRLRYKTDDWAPVFERNRQKQEARGRSLDPSYKFKF